jgi:nucleotide-binding universal stress UspA family protein
MKVLEKSSEIKLNNVLFATDFSRYSDAALPFAFAIAHQYGVKLFATHVLAPDSYLLAVPEGWDSVSEKHKEMDSQRLEEQLRGLPHQILNPVGDISDTIFQIVRDNDIDLLVLGTHGRSGLPKLLLGSVAEKLFRQSPIPVPP